MRTRLGASILIGVLSLLGVWWSSQNPFLQSQQPAPAPTYYVLADVGGTLMYLYPPTQAAPAPTFPNAATVSPTPIVAATPTRTASVTPTMVTPALPTVTDTPLPATNCAGGALPCWTEGYRAYEVVSQVWLCIYDTNPCGSDPERRLRLLAVGEKRYVWCVYEIAPGNVWASEFRCDAAFDRSWNAILYGGKRYMVEITP